MNFTSLQYFLVAAGEGNITHAAAKLYISQQALSGHIHKLEQELGVALFERAPMLTLTYAGRQLEHYAAEILDLERQIRQATGDISNDQRGEIRLGISHTCGRAILPSILPEYRAGHPLVDISLSEGNSSELEALLQHGKLDLVISYAPMSMEGIYSSKLIDERLFLVVPKTMLQHYFGACYDAIRNECLRNLDLSLFGRMPFILLKKGNRIRAMIDGAMKKVGFSPNLILETENIETAFALAQNGMGITVYPELFRWCIPRSAGSGMETVEFFPLTDDGTVGTLVIAWMQKHYQTRAAEDFVALCQRVLTDIQRRQTRQELLGSL